MKATTHRTVRAVITTTVAAAGLAVLPATVGPAMASTAERAPTMQGFLETELLDVHDFWTRVAAAANGPVTSVDHIFPLQGAGRPFAVPGVQRRLDVLLLHRRPDRLLRGPPRPAVGRQLPGQPRGPHGRAGRDVAVATMLAHEYAHTVQQQHGLLGAGYPGIDTELHADCWAGAWLRDSAQAGELDGGDLAEALAVMERVGDDEASYTPGTPDQRHDALQYGYDAAAPAACDAILDGTWLQ